MLCAGLVTFDRDRLVAAKTFKTFFLENAKELGLEADAKVAAILRRSVTPIRRMASMMGRVFAANKAAFSI